MKQYSFQPTVDGIVTESVSCEYPVQAKGIEEVVGAASALIKQHNFSGGILFECPDGEAKFPIAVYWRGKSNQIKCTMIYYRILSSMQETITLRR